jgi:hydrogenase maturation protease
VSVLVACIGNIFQGDDAFGCEVASALLQRDLAQDVRVVDFGIRGFDLTWALVGAPGLTILVDAVSRGGQPGTIYTIEPEPGDLDVENGQTVDAHNMDPVQVLRAAKAFGGKLGRILLVGCEPGDLGGEEGRMGLTPPVRAAVEEAATVVESLITKESQEVSI